VAKISLKLPAFLMSPSSLAHGHVCCLHLSAAADSEIEQLSLIISVYSLLPPRPSLKLNFSKVPAIQAWNWIFTRIFNPEGKKKSDIKQRMRVLSEPWQLCEVGLAAVMEDS